MKFTLGWLKEHLDTNATVAKISETLTAAGLEVEDVTDPAAKLKDFIVAEILEATPHPNANKLQVCRVNDGMRVRQIVCGATNARKGLKVALAVEGMFIPGSGITIKKTKIRDVESDGMLCSAEELQLAEKSEGIIELAVSARPGAPLATAMGAADPVFTINVTPNRSDCLSVRGIARDLAATGLGVLKEIPDSINAILAIWDNPRFYAFSSPITVKVDTPHCKAFTSIYLKNVQNKSSPEWMQSRLQAIGQKPISALVDITNYVMLDLGRPMHAYDADKIKGKITVRNAERDESFLALNGKEYILDNNMTVIADDTGVIGLAGIIGGERTACTETTTNVLLEMALFDPINIAQTGRKLDLLSDARYRFERGVPVFALRQTDPQPGYAQDAVAAGFMQLWCGGEVSQRSEDLAEGGWVNPAIRLRFERIKTLGGVEVRKEKIESILTALGFICNPAGDEWNVSVPRWRTDIEGEADLVEEVLRIHGYANITPVSVPASAASTALNPQQKRSWQAKRALASRGMQEVCSWSFLPNAQAALFGSAQPILLQNPISADLDALRPSLLPNLLAAAKNNIARSITELHLFEVGAQWSSAKAQEQKSAAAGIRIGNRGEASYDEGHYALAETTHDAFSAKADALALLEALGMNAASVAITRNTPPWYHPGRSGALTLGGKIVLGYFGEVHPGICQHLDIESRVAAFELFVDTIPQPRPRGTAKTMLSASAFQPVARDFAFVVKNDVTAAQITQALAQADKTLVKGIQILSVWSGKGIGEGHKSVAVRVTMQAADRTLTDADITAISTAIVTSANSFGGVLRQ